MNPNHVTTLQSYASSHPVDIRAIVARDALEADSPLQYLHEVVHHGAQQGAVPRLTYTIDTDGFFDTHYEEIEELRKYYQDDLKHLGCTFTDWKNDMTWFCYDAIAHDLYYHLIA